MTQHLAQGDPYIGAKLRNIVQGEYDATSDRDVVFTTVLGSCVSACLFDDERGVGGINHFLLPDGGDFDQQSVKYGSMAMELLINAMIKKGARRQAIKAKLF
ncbi:MAG: chemotaxis protein CheD, partial [Pseudomonadota bacterium]